MLHMAMRLGRFGTWFHDLSEARVTWSQEACALHEMPPGHCPTPEQAVEFFALQYRDAMRNALRACMRDGSPFEAEAQIVTAKGRLRWVRVIGEAQWDDQGRVRRIQGACQDITEQITAQREVLRLNAELEHRVRERTEQLQAANRNLALANSELEAFSYSVAHDLRGPLSTIDGFSQILVSTLGQQLPERSRHHLRRIRATAQQMSELVNGLLSLARLSRASLRREPVDLAALAQVALDACRERAPQREADIEIAAALPVVGDPSLLFEVMANLAGNAWKFSAKRERARIAVGATTAEDGSPVYYVRDNGAGFDMACASRMFEAFQRVHPSSEFEGTGVGLAIVHKIVARHGGRIWAESGPDQGASFYFTLGAQVG
ncbi:MAG TPA: ATP-binding protein [Ramlibacter sp.]|nr:ATP-binding protein [Ramlibacter sp.]